MYLPSAGTPHSRAARRVPPLKRFAPDVTVAGAKLVRLQRIQNAQDFFRVAPDIHVVHGNMLNNVVGIDNKRGPQRHAFGFFTDTKLVDQRTTGIPELVVVKAIEPGVFATPG